MLAQIVALVSICFIIISTVVLTLNTLPYFQVTTMVTTLITKMLKHFTNQGKL